MAANVAGPELPEINGYIVRAILGQGRHGTVCRAIKANEQGEDHKAVTEFAIKTYLNDETGEDSDSKEASQRHYDREVQFMKLVQGHANVVMLHECLHTQTAIVMSLHKCDLFSLVHASNGLSERAAAHVMRGLLSAVQHVHKRGVIHRDIKPENIAVDGPDNDAILLDFDSACLTFDTVATKTLAGTPGYMAPEVIRSVPYGAKADMFSVGGVMFYLFGKRNPFHPRTYSSKEACRKTLLEECKFGPRFDEIGFAGKQLILLLLAKNAGQRVSAQDALKHYWFVANTADGRPQFPVPTHDHSDIADAVDANNQIKASAPRAGSVRRRRKSSLSDVAQSHAAMVEDICSGTWTMKRGDNPLSLNLEDQAEATTVKHVVPLLPSPPTDEPGRVPRPSKFLQGAYACNASVKAS
eukprot:TRINITY_DN3964_c0_g2_i1.p1 TRINITY_DN3964_c0_g2~~TRINITY_DN3964_c0_g2_i1.p1  ORF type:complete len:421 (+),score=43.79 TRINITY_DN3964_c0_g2_i1:30-1265(+)